MLTQSNNININEIESIVEEKINQLDFVSIDDVNEIVAQAKVEPVETGVFLKKDEASEIYATNYKLINNYYDKPAVEEKIDEKIDSKNNFDTLYVSHIITPKISNGDVDIAVSDSNIVAFGSDKIDELQISFRTRDIQPSVHVSVYNQIYKSTAFAFNQLSRIESCMDQAETESNMNLYANKITLDTPSVVVSGSFYAPNIYNKEEIDTKIAEIPSGGGGTGNTDKIVGEHGMFGYTICDETDQRIVMKNTDTDETHFLFQGLKVPNLGIVMSGMQVGRSYMTSTFDVNTQKNSLYLTANTEDNDMKINIKEINCTGNLYAQNIYTKSEIDEKLKEVVAKIKVYYQFVGEDILYPTEHVLTVFLPETVSHYEITDDYMFPDEFKSSKLQYPYKYKIHTNPNGEKYITLRIDNTEMYTYRLDEKYSEAGQIYMNLTTLTEIKPYHLPLLALNGEKITNLSRLFNNRPSFTSIDFGNDFDTSAVEYFLNTFSDCRELKTIILSCFDTSSAITMENMFKNCLLLTELDLRHFNTKSVISFQCMFSLCESLTTLNVSTWDMSSVKNIYQMFGGCSALGTLDLTNWDLSNATDATNFISNCKKLTKIICSEAVFDKLVSLSVLDNTKWRYSIAGGYAGKAVSQTITHATNIKGEIGTFCETNGGIYDGYEKIDQTDCICQVVQSTTLNTKIVGIITSKSQFASHGDVLVKIVPGTYKLGDILCPDISGKARVATETEKQFMMLNAIPRPKITSLDTKIDGAVACFLV